MVKLLEFLDRHKARHLFRSSHLKRNHIPNQNSFFLVISSCATINETLTAKNKRHAMHAEAMTFHKGSL